MKKMFVALCLFGSSLSVWGQNEDYQHVVSVQSGVSLFSFFRGNIKGSTQSSDTTVAFSSGRVSAFPQLNLAYDYGINHWFSIGGAVSFNKSSLQLNDVVYKKNENLGNVTLGVSRLTIGARALFHYGNANRMDMYSGVRLGIGIWGVSGSSSAIDGKIDEIFKEAGGGGLWRSIIGDKVGAGFAMPQVQVIVFGLRGYLTERIGLNGELGFGSPYFASVGLNYRIGSL